MNAHADGPCPDPQCSWPTGYRMKGAPAVEVSGDALLLSGDDEVKARALHAAYARGLAEGRIEMSREGACPHQAFIESLEGEILRLRGLVEKKGT